MKNFIHPTHNFWVENGDKQLNNAQEAKELFRIFIKIMIKNHDSSKIFHDEMEALTLLDKDIAMIRKEQDRLRDENTGDIFRVLSIPFKGEGEEKIFFHYSFFIIDDLCHKIIYDDEIKDVDLYIEKCVNMVYFLFQDCTDYMNK